MDPVQRLAQLSAQLKPNPDRPFDTGLASNDFDGYVQRMKDQQELMGLQAQANGQAPPQIRANQSAVDPYAVAPATGMPNYRANQPDTMLAGIRRATGVK